MMLDGNLNKNIKITQDLFNRYEGWSVPLVTLERNAGQVNYRNLKTNKIIGVDFSLQTVVQPVIDAVNNTIQFYIDNSQKNGVE